MATEVLLSYSPEDRESARALVRHLTPMIRSGKITLWHHDVSEGGQDAEAEFKHRLGTAQIVLLLVSPDLEIDRDADIRDALEARQYGARVVPVLLRPVDVSDLRYGNLRMLPDSRPIIDRRDRDQAWVEVVQGIRRVVESLEKSGTARQVPAARQAPGSPETRPAAGTDQVRVLFVGAALVGEPKLALDQEARAIDQRIQLGKLRERIQLNQQWAITPEGLIHTLLRYRPTVLHFSGRGTEAGEILLADDRGSIKPVRAEALAQLFRALGGGAPRCVVLNACFSWPQAETIRSYVDCVIGISGSISDEAAIAFSAGFYTAVAAGENLQMAFELGTVQIALQGLPSADQLHLLIRPGLDPAALHLL